MAPPHEGWQDAYASPMAWVSGIAINLFGLAVGFYASWQAYWLAGV
jgi:hypothetical protein